MFPQREDTVLLPALSRWFLQKLTFQNHNQFILFWTEVFEGTFEILWSLKISSWYLEFCFWISGKILRRFYEMFVERPRMDQGSARESFLRNFPAPTLHVGVKATCLVRDVTLVRLLGRLSTDISIWTEKLFECKECNCRSLFPQFSSIISNISFESLNPLFLPLWVMCPQQTFKL